MNIFSLLWLAGAMAFFLFGMNVMSSSLEKMSGSRLERNLQIVPLHPIRDKAPLLGVTMALRPVTSATVILAGMVGSGIIGLGQATGVVMGMNLVSGAFAWALSLFGVAGENMLARLLKPEVFASIIALAGVIMLLLGGAGNKKYGGRTLLGFAVMLQGMQVMISALGPLSGSAYLAKFIGILENPLAGVALGALLSGFLQSLPASLALLQALSMTGEVSFAAAVPLIIGQSAGVGLISLVRGMGSGGKAVSFTGVASVQFWVNLVGAGASLAVFYSLSWVLGFSFIGKTAGPAGVALIYSGVAVVTFAALMILKRPMERFLSLRMRAREYEGREKAEDQIQLDESLLMSPAFSIAECRKLANRMALLARDTLMLSIEVIINYDEEKAELLLENEERLDRYEDSLGSFLVKLSSGDLTTDDSREISKLLLTIGDFERIGDHAQSILASAKEMHVKGISFSRAAQSELKVITSALGELLRFTIASFMREDMAFAARVEPLKQVIDELGRELKTRHIARLQHGLCTAELGYIFSDLLSDFERVSDHCSNIAVCVIHIKGPSFETHAYLDEDRLSQNPDYVSQFRKDKARYSLPLQVMDHEFEPIKGEGAHSDREG